VNSSQAHTQVWKTADIGMFYLVKLCFSLFNDKEKNFLVFVISQTEVESRPEVGSSRINIRGLVRSSVPMLVRFRSPPETSMMGVSTHRWRRSLVTTASTSAILRLFDQDRGNRKSAVYVSWSLIVTTHAPIKRGERNKVVKA